MSAPVVVRRRPDPEHPDKPWRAVLLDEPAADGLTLPTLVGRFESMPEAVRTGITAARFVAAGIPWRVQS